MRDATRQGPRTAGRLSGTDEHLQSWVQHDNPTSGCDRKRRGGRRESVHWFGSSSGALAPAHNIRERFLFLFCFREIRGNERKMISELELTVTLHQVLTDD
ncbi:hypothetical protein U1Q18_048139 [Sarracenia purpurea var. burkii]